MRSILDGGVQALLYTVLIHERSVSIEELAQAVGCRPATIYDYLERKPIIPITIIKAAYELTRDPRIKAALEPKGMELVPRDGQRTALPSFEAGMMDLIIDKGELARLWQEAQADGVIDDEESVNLDKLIHSMTLKLAALKATKEAARH